MARHVLLDEVMYEIRVTPDLTDQQCRAIKRALEQDLIVNAVVAAIAIKAGGAKPGDVEVSGWVPLRKSRRKK